MGRTGAKFAEPRPGKGNGKGRRLVQKSGLSAKAAGAIRPYWEALEFMPTKREDFTRGPAHSPVPETNWLSRD